MAPGSEKGKRGREVHRGLLEDETVRGWYNERALRSRLSADTYLRQLGGTLVRLGLTPPGLEARAKDDPGGLRAALVSYAGRLKREGRLDSYISKTFDGLRSWLRFRGIQFDGFPKLSPVRGESLEQERVPTPEELRRVLDRLGPRGRVVALLMAHSGVRPGVLGSYGAADGLTLGDLPDLNIGRRPSFGKVPFVVRVPGRLSKTRKSYITFGGSELASALLAYLDQRKSNGEQLGPDSPVVTVDSFAATHEFHGKKGTGRFLTTKGLVSEIRAALNGALPKGVTWRPYVLRSFCSTRLLIAESQGKIGRDLREAILGHDGGVAARYNVGKRWGDELLAEARTSYKRCESFLSTSPGKAADDGTARLVRILLIANGVPEKELEGLDLAGLPEENVLALLAKFGGTRAKSGAGAASPSRPAEEAIPLDEVPARLKAGWLYKGPLGPSMAVVTAPGLAG